MALSQLITTIDIANSNVGINNSAVTDGSVTNAVVLGLGQNVGIGTAAPLTGVHVAASGNTIPALYLADATDATLPTIGANDGVFSVRAGIPTFTNATGSQTLATSNPNITGTGTLVAGTVTITEAGVSSSSFIFLTRTTTTGIVSTVGTLNVVAGTGTFTVNSTVVTDVGSFNYLIIG